MCVWLYLRSQFQPNAKLEDLLRITKVWVDLILCPSTIPSSTESRPTTELNICLSSPLKSSRKPAVSLVGRSHCFLPSSRASGRTMWGGKKATSSPPPLPSSPAGNNRQSNILSGHARPFQVKQARPGRCLVTRRYSWEKGPRGQP